jgi:hypothetical protein
MKILLSVFALYSSQFFADNFFNSQEKQVFSQQGEDGIIDSIFKLIGAKDKFFVDIGAGDGMTGSNTYNLRLKGWKGVGFDVESAIPWYNIRSQKISKDNAALQLEDAGVSSEFDFLSLDIDSIDLYVLNTILKNGYRPRVICCEYNSSLGPIQDATIPYSENFCWDGSDFFGASYQAFKNVAKHYGYSPVCTDSKGINLFFVKSEELEKMSDIFIGTDQDIYHRPRYGANPLGGHRPDHLNRSYISSHEIMN